MTESGKEKKYDCTDCPYPRYKDSRVIFCDVCIRKILDWQREKKQRKGRRIPMENEEKRMISSYEVTQSIHIGKKEVVFGIDEKEEYPYLVCYCTYDNPLSAEWVTDAVGSDDYLEAMQMFTDRVQEQIESVRAEQEQFKFDMTPFTIDDCIPDDKCGSIVGKVVVINAEVNRHEYRHSAYQLVLADGGHGALGGRGQAVFGTSLADGKHARWERCDVLGEIKPEKMPVWAKEALAKIQSQEKAKKSKSREER